MTEQTTPAAPARTDRVLDAEALKGLSHPLRVAIYDALSAFGPATASGLAERLGESSGAMSYHLRQLERHGFVQEDPTRGTARERWWKRVPGGVTLDAREVKDSPAAQAVAASLVMRWQALRERQVRDFLHAMEQNPDDELLQSSTLTTSYLRITSEEALDIQRRYEVFLDGVIAAYRRDETPAGARAFLMNFNAIPLIDETIPVDDVDPTAALRDPRSTSREDAS